MKPYIASRTRELGEYVLRTNETIRASAKKFHISKSTVHYDLSVRLKKVDYDLYRKIKKILEKHFDEKHIRGGEATKLAKKALKEKKQNNWKIVILSSARTAKIN